MVDFAGVEKTLQEAINDGDFGYDVWIPSRADVCTTDTLIQTNCGNSRNISGTKSCGPCTPNCSSCGVADGCGGYCGCGSTVSTIGGCSGNQITSTVTTCSSSCVAGTCVSSGCDSSTSYGNYCVDRICSGGVCTGSGYTGGGGTPMPPCSCFVGGTQISMADGTFKNIEDVLIGDEVIGVGGSVNTVLKYDRPVVGDRSIYLINDKVQVTGEHPFMATEDWKVAELELFYQQKAVHGRYQDIEPSQMKIGDELLIGGSVEIVRSIVTTERPSDEMVYDFEVSGTHTYIADGFVVWDSK